MSPQGSSTAKGSSSGLDSVSHAFIQYPPLKFQIPEALGVMYDDANKLVLVPTKDKKVYSWPINKKNAQDVPLVIDIGSGQVLAVRFSLDCKIMAVQRSSNEVELINVDKAVAAFTQPLKLKSERILGFFWADCPTCNLVFVTNSGLELYSVNMATNGLKLVELKYMNVSWYVYTHESRLVLLASGKQCKTLNGYQFSSGGVIRLPKFDASLIKSEGNNKALVLPEDVHIATMYGRIYCLQVDRLAMQLNVYRFYRDAVVPQGCLPLFSTKVATSVVDNVLLVHQIDSKVVLLYDIWSDPKTPISAPLPLLLKGQGVVHGSSAPRVESSSASLLGSSSKFLSPENNLYGEGWVFVNPDIIMDHVHGLIWKIFLDLEAIAALSSDLPFLIGFLQRRKFEPNKAKQLTLGVLRSAIIERRSLSFIAEAVHVVNYAYANASKLNPIASSKQEVTMAQPTTTSADSPHGNKEAEKLSRLQRVGGVDLRINMAHALVLEEGSRSGSIERQESQEELKPLDLVLKEGSGSGIIERQESQGDGSGSIERQESQGDLNPLDLVLKEGDRSGSIERQESQGDLNPLDLVLKGGDGSSSIERQESQGDLNPLDLVLKEGDGSVSIERQESDGDLKPLDLGKAIEYDTDSPISDLFSRISLDDKNDITVEKPEVSDDQLSPRSEGSARSWHLSQMQPCNPPEEKVLDTQSTVGAAISPIEMFQHVFAKIEEESEVESSFLVASIIEYMRSAIAANLRIPPQLAVLVFHLLVTDARYTELWQFVRSKVIEPSKEVASLLLQIGDRHPAIYRLGMQMLSELGFHTEYVSLLLKEKRLLEALRYARQQKVETVPPATFLEAAASLQDLYKMATTLRFCLDFVPNFSRTADYQFYSEILKQQSISSNG